MDEDISNRVGGRNSSFSRKINPTTFIREKEYSDYCDLLRSIAEGLYGERDKEGLIKVEMILFSLADREIAWEVLKFYSNHLCRLANQG